MADDSDNVRWNNGVSRTNTRSKPGVMTSEYGGEDYSMYLEDDDIVPTATVQRNSSAEAFRNKLLRLLRIQKPQRRKSSDSTGSSSISAIGPSIHEMSFADTKIGCLERGYQLYHDENGTYCDAPKILNTDSSSLISKSKSPLMRRPSTRHSYLNSEVIFRRQKHLPLNRNGLSASLKDFSVEKSALYEDSVTNSSTSDSEEIRPLRNRLKSFIRSCSMPDLSGDQRSVSHYHSELNLSSKLVSSELYDRTCKNRSNQFDDSDYSLPNFSTSDVFVELESCITSL